ncbi:MAG: ABC transporter permease [Clostridium sp.]
MIYLIKAELFKMSKKKYNYILLAICTIMIIFTIATMRNIYISGYPITKKTLFEFMPITFIIITTGIVFFLPNLSEEYKNNTIKNSIIMGISKRKILLSKFISSTIILLIFAIVCLTVLLFSSLILEPGVDFSNKDILFFLFKFLVSFPTFTAALSIIYLLMIVIRNDILVGIIFYYGIIQIPFIVTIIEKLFSFNLGVINKFIIISNLSLLLNNNFFIEDYLLILIVGFFYTVGILYIALTVFNNQNFNR